MSSMVRMALRDMPMERLTKENANAIGGGFYRTVVNVSNAEVGLLKRYSEHSGLGISAIIRAAIGHYLIKFVM